jgi:hypothetical protein
MAKFAGYVGLAITLPGTLIWRALSGRPRYLVEDLAAGTMVGYAVEVLSYIPARAIGQPQLVLAIPGLALLVFAFVPRLRRFWRGENGVRVPLWWSRRSRTHRCRGGDQCPAVLGRSRASHTDLAWHPGIPLSASQPEQRPARPDKITL